MANDFRSARFWAREMLENAVFDGARVIDATMGNGHDTLWLCQKAGPTGRVYAFDVQEEAVQNTCRRLEDAGMLGRAELFCAGHERMVEFIAEPVDAVVFNLGWLPGAAHGVTTQTETTLKAVHAALTLLKEDGLLTLCIYPGHEEGARELSALLEWGANLDEREYDVLLKTYLNQSGDPPRLLAVRKKLRKKK